MGRVVVVLLGNSSLLLSGVPAVRKSSIVYVSFTSLEPLRVAIALCMGNPSHICIINLILEMFCLV